MTGHGKSRRGTLAKRALPALVAALVAAAAGESQAYCSEPLVPYCVKGSVGGEDLQADQACLADVVDFVSDLEDHADCLHGSLTSTEIAIERFRLLMEQAGELVRD